MRYAVFDTDGFDRSDTCHNLHRDFEVDRYPLAHVALAEEGKMAQKDVMRAIKQYKLDVDKPNPLTV